MNVVEKYYQLVECIIACKTLGALEICEAMINEIDNSAYPLTAQHLANEALQKRTELLTTRYADVE